MKSICFYWIPIAIVESQEMRVDQLVGLAREPRPASLKQAFLGGCLETVK